ncbi:unnamed protein product, partial [Allacma fusca]
MSEEGRIGSQELGEDKMEKRRVSRYRSRSRSRRSRSRERRSSKRSSRSRHRSRSRSDEILQRRRHHEEL